MSDDEFEAQLAADREAQKRHRRSSSPIQRGEYLSPADEARYVTTGADGLPNVRLVRQRGQLVMVVPEGMVNPRSASLFRLGIFAFRVRGVSYHEDAILAASLTPGTTIRLVREPANEFDANAIALYATRGVAPIGYVNKQNAARIAKILDDGGDLVAITLSGSPKGRDGDPVGVLVTTPATLAHLRRQE